MSATTARRYRSVLTLTQFSSRIAQRRRDPSLEPLEERTMMAVDLRSIDGSGNNLANPDWGSTGTLLLRAAPADYADGVSAPAGADRLSAREISNLVVAQNGQDMINNRDMAAIVYAWGQFLDHDLDLTDAGATEPLNVAVPTGDPQFDPQSTGTQTIGFTRSLYDSATGTDTGNPRQQPNLLTAFIDGSQIYGADAQRAAALRTFVGGQLRTSEGNMLPYNTLGLPNGNSTGLPPDQLYLAGDVRANENIELTALQTLFVREHNRLAARYASQNPGWTDEQIYQQARRIVIGELQAITYNEFLPALLGAGAIPKYRGYSPLVNPGISTEFSTAAFRLGHSMLGDDVEFLDNNGAEVSDAVELRNAFFNPSLVAETGIDPILKYLASDRAQELDVHIVDEVRNFLFGQPGQGGFDLASLNIQRGRDHGLADYNSTRVAFGLKPVQSFADITKDVATQNALKAAYGSVDNIDLWVGGLAEDHVGGGSLGPLFRKILVDQFSRLRDGDRFWYQRDLTGRDLTQVEGTTLADVIRRNTTISNLQDNVFFFHATLTGQVFGDANGNGRQDRRETGLGGITVQLIDTAGTVVATTTTRRDGSYTFESLDLGAYRVKVVLPTGAIQTSRDPREQSVTRGVRITSIDFGIQLRPQQPSTSPTGPRR